MLTHFILKQTINQVESEKNNFQSLNFSKYLVLTQTSSSDTVKQESKPSKKNMRFKKQNPL